MRKADPELFRYACIHWTKTYEWDDFKLKAWRRRMHWTQAQAAKALGMCNAAYNKRENGATRISRCNAMACALIEQEMWLREREVRTLIGD